MAYTSFFRDRDVLDLIASHVIPEVSVLQEIKVWDAGCSTGEEAYSIAILFAENLGPFALRNLRILASDKEESAFPQFERIIAAGRYHRQDVMWVPEPLRSKYFHAVAGDEFDIDQEIKDRVKYVRHDLLTLQPVDDHFCLVVCKNVLMHLPPASRVQVIEMFHRVLRPGGVLALDCYQELPADNSHLFTRVARSGQVFRKVEAA